MLQELSAADAASVSAAGYIHLYHKELDNMSLGPQALLGVGEPGTGKDDIVCRALARLPARRVNFNQVVMELVGGSGGKRSCFSLVLLGLQVYLDLPAN